MFRVTSKKKNKNRIADGITLELKKNKALYIMILPVIIYFAIFSYYPMYGAVIAFKSFSPGKGIMGSDWVGLKNFIQFFHDIYFTRVLKNTLLLSLYTLALGFPVPIILALLLNEVRLKKFKKVVQTVTYLPHFISLVVIVGLLKEFSASNGLFNDIASFFGGNRMPLLQMPGAFRPLYIGSEIWQTMGWNSIIYLAALSGVDEQLYEAARIDGANRWKQMLHITLPGIMSTIVILFILRMGSLFTVGFEKVILMYNPTTYETADVISSYVYRLGLLQFNYSYSTAVGLFNSVMNFILLILSNGISKRVGQSSLW